MSAANTVTQILERMDAAAKRIERGVAQAGSVASDAQSAASYLEDAVGDLQEAAELLPLDGSNGGHPLDEVELSNHATAVRSRLVRIAHHGAGDRARQVAKATLRMYDGQPAWIINRCDEYLADIADALE